MSKDRHPPFFCIYYIGAGLCSKGRKADHAHYCQYCNKYKPRARVKYKNQKKEKLEKIRMNERYYTMYRKYYIEELPLVLDPEVREKCNN